MPPAAHKGMKTIIFDIDGTITSMWPIEKSVLLAMLGKEAGPTIENVYQSGITDTCKLFSTVSRSKIGKAKYRRIYNQTFVLLERNKCLPKAIEYPVVTWIRENKAQFHFVYATGGQAKETAYILSSLKLESIFDLRNSLNSDNCRYPKSTGLPFKQMKAKWGECFLVTDSQSDCDGARRANISYLQIKPGQKFENPYFT